MTFDQLEDQQDDYDDLKEILDPQITGAAVPEVRKGRRPKVPRYDTEKILSTKHLLEIKNYDASDVITKATIDGNSLVVGTKKGKIYKINKNTFETQESY